MHLKFWKDFSTRKTVALVIVMVLSLSGVVTFAISDHFVLFLICLAIFVASPFIACATDPIV